MRAFWRDEQPADEQPADQQQQLATRPALCYAMQLYDEFCKTSGLSQITHLSTGCRSMGASTTKSASAGTPAISARYPFSTVRLRNWACTCRVACSVLPKTTTPAAAGSWNSFGSKSLVVDCAAPELGVHVPYRLQRLVNAHQARTTRRCVQLGGSDTLFCCDLSREKHQSGQYVVSKALPELKQHNTTIKD